MGGQDFTTCPPDPVTREGDLGHRMPRVSSMRISITHCGSRVASVLSASYDGT
jgi:hypothetical protein